MLMNLKIIIKLLPTAAIVIAGIKPLLIIIIF